MLLTYFLEMTLLNLGKNTKFLRGFTQSKAIGGIAEITAQHAFDLITSLFGVQCVM